MRSEASLLPSRQTLMLGLNSIFTSNSCSNGPVISLRRRQHCRASSFPSEVVTCRFNDGKELQVFCKYGGDHYDNDYGHWGGISYEANVYRLILQPLALSRPAYYGEYIDKMNGKSLLFLEYVNDAVSVNIVSDCTAAMISAARWIGQFHAVNERVLASAPMPFLNIYDAAYYLGWEHRTAQFAEGLPGRFQWLVPLCKRFEEVVDVLLTPPLTVIHGEYTMHNTLIRDDSIYPVDWETAAIALGEIDLAFLTDGWSADVVQACERAYQQARWPTGAPEGYERRLAAARLYMQFLWLGCKPEITLGRGIRWRFKLLCSAGERLGLI